MGIEWLSILLVPVGVVLFFAWLEARDYRIREAKKQKEIVLARTQIKRRRVYVRR